MVNFETSAGTITLRLCLLLLAYAALYFDCRLWVKRDYAEIEGARGKHELNRKFHRQGWLWKAASVTCIGTVYATFGYGWRIAMLYALASFLLSCVPFWWYFFDRWLNVRRDLSLWYFGKNAGTDKFLTWIKAKTGWQQQHIINRVKIPLLLITGILAVVAVFQ